MTTIMKIFNRWNDVRVTRRALMSMTDRELNDIGIGRGDIERISREV